MEKIILRNKLTPNAKSNYIDKYEGLYPDKNEQLWLRIIYEEDMTYENLFSEYLQAQHGKKSALFSSAYRINDTCAVVIDEHITLYRLCKKFDNVFDKKIPWNYCQRSVYLGDSWWYDDEEILDDLLNLNTTDFLLKYKGRL